MHIYAQILFTIYLWTHAMLHVREHVFMTCLFGSSLAIPAFFCSALRAGLFIFRTRTVTSYLPVHTYPAIKELFMAN